MVHTSYILSQIHPLSLTLNNNILTKLLRRILTSYLATLCIV